MDGKRLVKFALALVILGYNENIGVKACELSDYFMPNIMERFVQADIVVYGKTTHHLSDKVLRDGKFQYVIDAVYDVYCVIKRQADPVAEQITIAGIAPKKQCTGTDASKNMKVGDHSIVALKTTDEVYTLHEVMPVTNAVAPAYKPYLVSLSNVCGMQSWQAPFDAGTNRCPICGTADFDPSVREIYDYNEVKNCVHMWSATETNMTDCDLYMKYSVEEANSLQCIPEGYANSCVELVTRPLTATCNCNDNGDKRTRRKLNVGGSGTILPSVSLMALLLAYLTLS